MQKFVVGEVYACRSLCDYDCIYRFEIKKRTDRTVWIEYHGEITKRRIFTDYNGHEAIHPHGRYSMAPTLSANDAAVDGVA